MVKDVFIVLEDLADGVGVGVDHGGIALIVAVIDVLQDGLAEVGDRGDGITLGGTLRIGVARKTDIRVGVEVVLHVDAIVFLDGRVIVLRHVMDELDIILIDFVGDHRILHGIGTLDQGL